MKRFIFVLGGARSGKSRYALDMAKGLKKKTAFIATAAALDSEMAGRIKKHKRSRPPEWSTVEEQRDIPSAITRLRRRHKVLIIDCLGMLIANLLEEGLRDREIEKELNRLISAITESGAVTLLISNEVGLGIVPDNAIGRRFRDLIGSANKRMAKKADEVIFMQAGIPLKLKGREADL